MWDRVSQSKIPKTQTHTIMNREVSSIPISLSLFDDKHYYLWAVRMEAYLDVCDLWEAVEDVYEVPPLLDNPMVAQIKNHKERK